MEVPYNDWLPFANPSKSLVGFPTVKCFGRKSGIFGLSRACRNLSAGLKFDWQQNKILLSDTCYSLNCSGKALYLCDGSKILRTSPVIQRKALSICIWPSLQWLFGWVYKFRSVMFRSLISHLKCNNAWLQTTDISVHETMAKSHRDMHGGIHKLVCFITIWHSKYPPPFAG